MLYWCQAYRIGSSSPTRRSPDLRKESLAFHLSISFNWAALEPPFCFPATLGCNFVPNRYQKRPVNAENLSLRAVATHRFTSRSEEHTSELQSRFDLVCRLLLEKK